MKVVIGVLCFTVMVLINPIESMFSFLKTHPMSISEISNNELKRLPKLSADCYLMYHGGKEELKSIKPGPLYVGIKKIGAGEYVIGYVEDAQKKNSTLYPFIVSSEKSKGSYTRIMIRIEGNYANKYIPLPENSQLNTCFFVPHNPNYIHLFNIDEKSSRRPLVPVKSIEYTEPATASKASSSRPLASGGQPGHLLDFERPEIPDVTGDQVKKWRQPSEYNPKP